MSEPADRPAADAAPDGPYVGLKNYSEREHRLFFGRDRERQALIGNLRTSRFTLLYAQSGAGKSSLLRAGVVPRLRQLGAQAAEQGLPRFEPVVLSSWSEDPLLALGRALGDQAGVALDEAIQVSTTASGATLLIIFDQFEEYFRHQHEGASTAFAEAIGRCVSIPRLPVNFLVSIREDAYASVGGLFKGHVPNVYGNYLQLLPLDVDGAEQAIRKPLQVFGVEPEDELVRTVLDGVRQVGGHGDGASDGASNGGGASQYVATAYLQLVMRAVWEARGSDGGDVLRLDTLRQLGGPEEIIQSHLRLALELPERQRRLAAAALRYLVPSDRGKLTLTAAQLSDFTGYRQQELEPVLDHLDEERILAAGVVPGSYEIFHDVLARDVIRWRGDYEHEVQTKAERAEKEKRVEAEQRERHERAAKVKAEWRVRALLIAGAVVLLAAVGIVIVTILAQRQRERDTAQSAQLAARAQEISDLSLSSLYALEAYRISHTPEARGAILRTADTHQLGMPFATSGAGVSDVAWSADGRTIVTAAGDGSVALWDAISRKQLARMAPSPDTALGAAPHLNVAGSDIGSLALSPDGRFVAFGQNVNYYDLAGNPQSRGSVWLWDLQQHRTSSLLTRAGRINGIAFSPDGRRLALANSDRTVLLIAPGARRRPAIVLHGHRGAVNAVAFSPDGRKLAASSCDPINHEDTHDHSVLLWDTLRGRPAGRLNGQASICALAFSPDGKVLATASDDYTISLWDLARRQRLGLPLVGHTDVLSAVAFSPDGKILASASRDHTVRLWDVHSQRQLGAPLKHIRAVSTVAFSVAGKTLVSGGADGARIWSVHGRNELGALQGGVGDQFLSVAFSRRLLAASSEGKVHLWDAASTRQFAPIPAPAHYVNSLAFSADGNVLAWAGSDHTVWIWSVAAGHLIRRITGPKPSSLIERVAVSSDGMTVAFADTDIEHGHEVPAIRLWRARDPSRVVSIQTNATGGIGALAFDHHASKLASAGYDGTVRLWDVRRLREIGRPLIGHGGPVYGVAFSPDDRTLASGGSDETVRFWDVASQLERGAPLTEHTGAVYSVAFSPDGRTLASASLDQTVRIWDVTARVELFTLTGHTGFVFGVSFSPTGTLASASSDGTVRLWGGFSSNEAVARLCSYVDKRAAPHLWRQYEPAVAYRKAC